MLAYFQEACIHLKRKQQYKIWQDGYHAEIVRTNWFIKQKINYIHNNPVSDKSFCCLKIIILAQHAIMLDWIMI